MKFQHLIKAAVVALALGSASHAMADVIAINASGLPQDGYLSAGTYNGSFNGTGLLPAAYTVNNLTFDFKFADDGSDLFNDVPGTSVFVSEVWSVVKGTGQQLDKATRTTTYLVPVLRTYDAEAVTLKFGGLSFEETRTTAGGTTTGTPTAPVPAPAVNQNSFVWLKNVNGVSTVCDQYQIDHDASCKKSEFFTVTKTSVRTDTAFNAGAISFSGDLVSSLFQNDKLDFGLTVTGDLYLTKASLDVTFTEDAVAPPAAVPEPGSLALFGIAMLGAVGVIRKRRA